MEKLKRTLSFSGAIEDISDDQLALMIFKAIEDTRKLMKTGSITIRLVLEVVE